jgi:uncharacterized Fe-S center protein
LLEKLDQLLDAAGFASLITSGDVVALKVSFGEAGNTTHIRPHYLQRIVRKVKHYGGRPFLTDTLPTQGSRRLNSVDHMLAATQHGFGYETIEAPLVVADGLLGRDGDTLQAAGRHFEQAVVASAIAQADVLICINHFTGHEPTGFAGALLSLGLGCTTGAGKAQIATASEGTVEDRRAGFQALQERNVEFAAALASSKPRKVGYINMMLDLTPEWDNQAWSDAAVTPDIGILASRDPVGLDQASADLFNQAPGIPGTRLSDPQTKDKFRDLFPGTDWEAQLKYAQELGMGSRDYELMII